MAHLDFENFGAIDVKKKISLRGKLNITRAESKVTFLEKKPGGRVRS